MADMVAKPARARMGRPPKQVPEGATARATYSVRLSSSIRSELLNASEKSGRSISEEIERRLDQSFRVEAIDPDTRDLAELMALSVLLAQDIVRQDIPGVRWSGSDPASSGAARYCFRRAMLAVSRAMGIVPVDLIPTDEGRAWAARVDQKAEDDDAADQKAKRESRERSSFFDRLLQTYPDLLSKNDAEPKSKDPA